MSCDKQHGRTTGGEKLEKEEEEGKHLYSSVGSNKNVISCRYKMWNKSVQFPHSKQCGILATDNIIAGFIL